MNSLLLCLLVVLLPCANQRRTMETFFRSIFVTLFALCITPSALALKCEVRTNLPAEAGLSAKPCTAPDVVECPFRMGRCVTITGEIAIPGAGSLEFTVKNCSDNALICEPDVIANMCKNLSTNGYILSCTTDCCETDNCNGVSGAEAAGLSVWLASFTAILMALHKKFLN